MGSIDIDCRIKRIRVKGKREYCLLYKKNALKKFNPVVLGLGNIGEEWEQLDVIAAVFDLAGFTSFCSQVDPHLSLPKFVKEFLNWLFREIKTELKMKEYKDGVGLYSELPIFAKFMGDGVLFLWDATHMHIVLICNVALALREVAKRYHSNFVPKMRKRFSNYPERLRCGVALGRVSLVGEGEGEEEDYVGPCINIASRLQKYTDIEFCLWQKGIDIKKGMLQDVVKEYTVKSVEVRGVGQKELVIVSKSDLAELSAVERRLFKAV